RRPNQLVAAEAAIGRENRRNRTRHGPAGQFGLLAGVKVGEQTANDLERQIVVTLHRQHETQTLEVGGRELSVPRLGAGRADQVAILEKAKLRGREVRKL